MGSNSSGQLGINDPYTTQKFSPVLVEVLLDKAPMHVKCGDVHSLVLCRSGDVYSWGNNDYGQCGGGNTGSGSMAVIFSPRLVNFDNYYRPNIQQIDCGSEHSAFIDDIGRLFTCGRCQNGQLGLGSFADEAAPVYVSKIPDKVNQVACGQAHTVTLTMKGEVYVMGANTSGQLGTGPPSKGSPIPILLEELSFSRMVQVRAGSFSAALSTDH
jgi:alpha-tubulin suppressor-like RCC1 family protein